MDLLTAWAVDDHRSAALMNQNCPAYLTLSRGDLVRLDTVVYLYKDKILTDVPLPDVVVSVFELVQAGLLDDLGNKIYLYEGCKQYFLSDYRFLVSVVSVGFAHAISHAIQLVRWRSDHRFCGRCGGCTYIHSGEYASICSHCNYHNYPRISPCVITAITRICPSTYKPQILLALHHRHRDVGMHGLIAGFVEIGESLETAVARESLEETGIQVGNIRYIASQPWPYPTNLMMGFIAEYLEGEVMADVNELVYARFFDLDNLPKIPQQGTIAYDLIQRVLADYKA